MLPLLVGLFLLEMRLPFSEAGHEVAQLVILGIIFCLVHLWLRANASALGRSDAESYPLRITVIHFPAGGSTADHVRPKLQLPSGEIKNVLGTTFELEVEERVVDSLDPVETEVSKR
jgi:hypothetical protein